VHPAVLRELGLSGAITSLAARCTVPVTLRELPSRRVDAAAEAAAYFVIMEAVANAHKHADASAIAIDVHYALPWLYVSVRDNGAGGAHEVPGSGLAGLRERVESLDGELELHSSTGGTTVEARIPAFPA
jgi:signal transduction histidine kinase